MYKFLSVEGEEFKIENKETKQIITLSSVEQICDFLKKNHDDINSDFVLELLDNVTNENSYIDILNVSSWFLELPQKELYNFIDKNLKKINSKIFHNLAMNLRDSLKIKFYKQHKNSLEFSFQVEIIKMLKNDKLKLDFVKQNKDSLDEKSQVEIIETLKSDKFMLNFLEQNPNLSDKSKRIIFEYLSFESLSKIYKENKFNVQSFITIDYMFFELSYNSKQLLDFIEKNLDKISTKNLDKIVNSNKGLSIEKVIDHLIQGQAQISRAQIVEILKQNQDKLNMEQIAFLIHNSSPKQQEKYYERYESKLDESNRNILALILKETPKNKDKIDKILKECGLSNETKSLADKILKNLGFYAFINPNITNLLLNEGLKDFNEDTIYQLSKYFSYTDTMPDVSKVAENKELFEKFQTFRKTNVSQNLLDVINIKNTLAEFNLYYNLIEDSMETELTETEHSMLISVLEDKHVEVANKEDLKNYPAKRSEYIDKLIEKGDDSAIIYLLTGMTLKEFRKKEVLFFKDDQLKITLNDFSEELQEEIHLMQISKEIIKLIKNEPEEKRNEILQVLKKDLEQEFTSQGSCVANLRNVFTEFETSLRTLYGKELQESLKKNQLPKPQKKWGVDVIKLNGENFKMLVHGLNAYGHGKSIYQNSDIGQSYLCTSLISNKYLGRASASIYYGFSNISKKSLALEGSSDIYSEADTNSLNITANRRTKFLKTDQLLDKSKKEEYNEIVLFRDQIDEFGNVKQLIPDYIVAFNKITMRDRREARRLNIPIVLINEKAYENQNEQEENIEVQQEEKTSQEKKQENIQEEKTLTDVSQVRERMIKIIKQAKDYCTAKQQEVIMAEIQKEVRLLREQEIEKQEEHNV